MTMTRDYRCEKVAHFSKRKDGSMRQPGQLINDNNNNNIVMRTKASEKRDETEMSSDWFDDDHRRPRKSISCRNETSRWHEQFLTFQLRLRNFRE